VPDSLLTQEQLIEFQRRWRPYDLSLDAGLKLRHRAKADLFFLAKELLGCSKLKDPAHREVCEFFVKKDPTIGSFEEFARGYQGLHDRALSLMRHGFKSTLDICDKVQWVINWPEIRINLMTSVLSLSQEFVGAFKKHFTLQEDGQPKIMPDGRPSLFQILFPEFCDTRSSDYDRDDSPQWTTPARYIRHGSVLSPTIRASSAKAGKTGTHCDLSVFDDVCTEDSIGTEGSAATNLKKIARKISMARNLRVKYGFTDFIFTPYVESDYNCQIVAMERKRAQQGLEPLVAILIRPAAKLTPLAIATGKSWDKLLELDDCDVELWDSEECNLEDLKREWSLPNGRDMVASQKLLDVSLKTKVKFTREMLVQATKPWNLIPEDGLVVISGDLAYSTKERADLSVLGTATIKGGRIYLTAIKRDRVEPRNMPRWIADEIYRRRPNRVAVEDSVGVQWLHKDIEDHLRYLGWVGPAIEWVPIGQGRWKRTEMDADLPSNLFSTGRLILSTAIEKLEDAYEELEAFPSPRHHDDIVAMLNLLCRQFISETDMVVGEAENALQRKRDSLWEQKMMGYGPGAARNDRELSELISLELPN
jgi:phage terminase large subunit-like protein